MGLKIDIIVLFSNTLTFNTYVTRPSSLIDKLLEKGRDSPNINEFWYSSALHPNGTVRMYLRNVVMPYIFFFSLVENTIFSEQ